MKNHSKLFTRLHDYWVIDTEQLRFALTRLDKRSESKKELIHSARFSEEFKLKLVLAFESKGPVGFDRYLTETVTLRIQDRNAYSKEGIAISSSGMERGGLTCTERKLPQL